MTLSLRQARRLKEKTQNEMAKLLGINPDTYRKIEVNPDLATIEQAKKIADYLGFDLDEIFFARESQLN